MTTAAPDTLPFVREGGLFAQTREFNQDPLVFLTRYKPIYGPTYKVRMVRRAITVTADPEWMRYILQTHHKDFGRGFAYKILRMALGNGLLVNDGDSWMRQRRLAQPAFYKKRLADLFGLMEDKADVMLGELEAQDGQTIDITQTFWKVTSDIVIATLLGGEGFTENQHLQDAITKMQEYLVARIRRPYRVPLLYLNGSHRRFKQLMREFDREIYRIIEEKRASGTGGSDLLSMLMEARDEDSGEGMSEQQLRDEFLTIYVAGHETSSYALSWTMYLLAQHPEIADKVREEASKIPADGRMSVEALRGLEYVNQVLLESMRLYPPAWITGRMTNADHMIGNTPVKKGEPILLNVYALHRDPLYWDNPETFRPERFSKEAQKGRDKFTYIPFGAGPRMCIGNNFAIMEITMLLAKLFRHFDFELEPGQDIVPDPLITLRPKHGIRMRIKRRPE